MNARTVWRLAAKDLHLLRIPVALYLGTGALAIVLSGIDDRAARSLGTTLAINVFLAACFHLVLGNVLGERERKTLAFTLSLPVSPREVTAGKLVSSVGMYALCGTLAAVALRLLSPDELFVSNNFQAHALGWLAYLGLTLGGFLVFFSIVLATAIVSESLGWTIGVTTTLIVVVGNGLFLAAPRLRFLMAYVGELRRGGPAVPTTLAAEALLLGCILAATFWMQGRKRSYL
jgi:ABC-type Na+ efflux pump permease subunit